METALYRTDSERQAAITAAERRGLTQVHDDYGVGSDGENRLEFDVVRSTPVTTTRRQVLRAQAQAGDLTAAEIQEALQLIL
jgi:hypothetical protein